MCKKQRGFTLIEMMIVVLIIAVLVALAYPSYNRYGFRARRADGKEMIMRIAAAEERYFTTFNRYTDNAAGELGMGNGNIKSEQGHYDVSFTVPNDGQTYTLTATPLAVQVDDTCGALTYTNSGDKGPKGKDTNGACW